MVADQSEHDMLQDILSGVMELLADSRRARQELQGVRKELDERYDKGEYSPFGYQIRDEQLKRSYQTLEFYVRKLEQQKKLALQKLRELE